LELLSGTDAVGNPRTGRAREISVVKPPEENRLRALLKAAGPDFEHQLIPQCLRRNTRPIRRDARVWDTYPAVSPANIRTFGAQEVSAAKSHKRKF
jgi:hypothetical protein